VPAIGTDPGADDLRADAGFLSWTYVTAHTTHHNGLVPPFLPPGLVVLAGVGWLMREHLEGWAFVATALVIVILFVTLFLNLYPRVLVSR